jgi:hypothetical protein
LCHLPVSAMWAIGNRENFTKRMYVDLSSSGAKPWGEYRERRGTGRGERGKEKGERIRLWYKDMEVG